MQNTSHAVMQQRTDPKDSLDFFPTPPWATRALCERIVASRNKSVWEPACGAGHMAIPLKEYFSSVFSSDVQDYGYKPFRKLNFLAEDTDIRYDWIITNPPFNLAEDFIQHALYRANSGVAVLVRIAFLESVGRYHALFRTDPPSDIYQFAERVPMQKGILNRKGSTATAYCWVVWNKEGRKLPTLFNWIGPCRSRLERDSDYTIGVASNG